MTTLPMTVWERYFEMSKDPNCVWPAPDHHVQIMMILARLVVERGFDLHELGMLCEKVDLHEAMSYGFKMVMEILDWFESENRGLPHGYYINILRSILPKIKEDYE